jgi:hypothetical protein
MKRVLIASLLSLAAAPVFAASTPSFNDFPEQGQLEASHAVIVNRAPFVNASAPSFNDFPEQGQLEAGRAVIVNQADLDALRANGVAGRAAAEVAKPANVFWAPY